MEGLFGLRAVMAAELYFSQGRIKKLHQIVIGKFLNLTLDAGQMRQSAIEPTLTHLELSCSDLGLDAAGPNGLVLRSKSVELGGFRVLLFGELGWLMA